MKIRNPFSFNKSGWKDDVTKRKSFGGLYCFLLFIVHS